MDPTLREIMQDPDPLDVQVVAGLERRGPRYTGHLESDFLLPGADHFRAWLPEDFPHEEFESLEGEIAVTGDFEAPRAGATLRLDLGANSWVERGLAIGAAAANLDSLKAGGLRALTARVDTLEIALQGVVVSASGELEPGSVDLELEAVMTDFLIPGHFASPDLDGAEISLEVAAALTGSLEEPEIDARAQGGFRQETVVIPAFDFQLNGDRQNVAARVQAGGGLVFEGTSLDSVRAEVRGRLVAVDSLAANFGLAAWKGTSQVVVGGAVRGDTLREVHIDSLILRALDRQMRIA